MKTLDSALESHLQSGATTLCWCYALTRKDGVQLGFTDHDDTISFDGLDFAPTSGFSGSEATVSLGLSVDDMEIEGVLDGSSIRQVDLDRGLFDGADLKVYRVNWAAPAERVLMRTGNLGEVTRRGGAFTAEFRGLAHALQQPQGRVYQSACDAELGDARCGVDLTAATLSTSASVLADRGEGWMELSGLADFAENWFAGGLFAVKAGALSGYTARVRANVRLQNGTDRLALWATPPSPLEVGTEVHLTVGCDKRFVTCRDRFGNGANFRGFPHIPGNEFVLGYPRRGDPRNDGSSRNG
ncbi:MAG: DUF2163 domain-containing protein [Pseudomonadota bacterium]